MGLTIFLPYCSKTESARTGKSAVKTLSKLGGFNVFIYDKKEYEKIEKELKKLKDFKFKFLTNKVLV